MIRYFLPLDPDAGLAMISYTDTRFADSWNNVPETSLTNELMIHLRNMFPEVDIPEPLSVRKCYWKEGVHAWTPGVWKYTNTADRVRKHGYAVAGEMFSTTSHGWIEGALETAETACDSIMQTMI